jgi:hypothetical protein
MNQNTPPMRIFGMRVFANPLLDPKPKVAFSPACPASDQCRAEFNAWALKLFGMTEAQCIVSKPLNAVFCGASIYEKLKEATQTSGTATTAETKAPSVKDIERSVKELRALRAKSNIVANDPGDYSPFIRPY